MDLIVVDCTVLDTPLDRLFYNTFYPLLVSLGYVVKVKDTYYMNRKTFEELPVYMYEIFIKTSGRGFPFRIY